MREMSAKPQERPGDAAAPAAPEADAAKADRPPHRSLRSKLFGIGVIGWLRLAALSVLVGVVLRLAGVNPLAPEFSLGGAASAVGRSAVDLAGWAISNGWAPLLTGAVVVAPLWLVWRVVTLPFRS
jgi:hypothetical protein